MDFDLNAPNYDTSLQSQKVFDVQFLTKKKYFGIVYYDCLLLNIVLVFSLSFNVNPYTIPISKCHCL